MPNTLYTREARQAMSGAMGTGDALARITVPALMQRVRLEHGSAGHLGYDTPTFTLDAEKSPSPPAPTGHFAAPGVGRVFLTWARSGDTTRMVTRCGGRPRGEVSPLSGSGYTDGERAFTAPTIQ